ncbi:MAG: hypothetical protein E7409_04965 [Ruminococcaceae bacterium]|nr:hypothetical protein [Oscillospiraceae bacterium]
MKTGFSRLCINPPLGAPLSGYYEARFTKGVLDDLCVTAVAFDDGNKKAVVLAVDVIMLQKEICDKFRKVIADFCGLPMEAIFINCSHTHTGPMLGKDFASDLCGDALYEEYLAIQMRDAAMYALEDVCESKFYQAQGEAKGISFIRRFRMKDGSVQTNPGVDNPDIDHALGEPNETVKLIKIVRENAEDIFLVNYGVHPDSVGGEYVSADYPGIVCATIEATVEDTKCVFLLAPQGDVNHINTNPSKAARAMLHDTFDGCPRGYEYTKHMGRVIAGAVLQMCGVAEEINADCIEYACKTVVCPSNQENHKLEEARRIVEIHESGRDEELPYKDMELTTVVAEAVRIVELENGPDSFDFTLSAIKLGDMVFAGIPGEPFTELANRIYAGSPFDTTILCCVTNGGESYFPASSAYEEGGYEARTSRLKKGADDIIVNGTVELLKELK